MFEIQIKSIWDIDFDVLNFDYWCLFVIWDLRFGAFTQQQKSLRYGDNPLITNRLVVAIKSES